ncbi:hypothetical protein SmJEL517_g04560 [Synchytrium microbalum]|uniref:Aldehyde dehydrogenase domain-containing protein n=1 Tax=Synchytrium microbalum TaxID=1806994 RepID=A0A507C3W1_9FUNG|nr:uncharacterized protein SmJEL517_g04560 [Synchytrium microbalum]TPX32255.1 hypothetical protein SmJEL517_g04560 [Synchytrium microbalum]
MSTAASYNNDTHVTFSYKGKSYTVPTGLFIGGKFIPSVSGKKFKSVNPATGEAFIEFFEGDKADVDLAVAAARDAVPRWAKITPAERGRLMQRLADLYQQNLQVLAELESIDNGKSVNDARGDVLGTIGCLRYYAGWADKIHGKVVDVDPNLQSYTRHEPFGIVGQIIPWNFPLSMQGWKLGPALATGNCIVMKTSEKTPLTGLFICQLFAQAGFPPGVLNVLSGFGPTCGNAIAVHPEILKVAFTGSTATGRRIMAAAAMSNLKKVSLELGGKSANIVFPDADINKAVFWSTVAIFSNMGQACTAGSRVFVHESIYDEFMTKFRAAAATFKVGDPFDKDTRQGPLVDETQFNRVLSYIEQGKKEGAKVEIGGHRVGDKGYFVSPTILSNVNDNMTVVKEEIFGPVVVALKFKDEAEVIARANNTEYGLAAALHTKNIQTAVRVSNALKAGTVWVNTYHRVSVQMPFGGYKQSGIGRELGEYGLQEYFQVKSVFINLD